MVMARTSRGGEAHGPRHGVAGEQPGGVMHEDGKGDPMDFAHEDFVVAREQVRDKGEEEGDRSILKKRFEPLRRARKPVIEEHARP